MYVLQGGHFERFLYFDAEHYWRVGSCEYKDQDIRALSMADGPFTGPRSTESAFRVGSTIPKRWFRKTTKRYFCVSAIYF